MSIALGLALAAALTAKPDCSWDRPGVNPFMGDVVLAVDRYTDIAPEVRTRLKQRMQARQYDDMVSIRRDSIAGKFNYDPALRDMHFGAGAVCAQVSRSKWSAVAEERGLVYCEQDQCIIVPTICRNVSRITRRAAAGSTADVDVLAAPILVLVPPAAVPELAVENYGPGSSTTQTAPGSFGGLVFQSPPLGAGAFAGLGAAAGLLTPVLLDNTVTSSNPPSDPVPPSSPVPEPRTWALMLAGLAALALRTALRQRIV